MSKDARVWVERHSTARGNARFVLEKLAFAARDAQGRGALRTQHELVAATGLHRATVQRALKQLRDEGHIRAHRGCRCEQCLKASRGTVVYDVLVGEREDVAPGQQVLDVGAATGRRMRPVTSTDRPQNAAPTGRSVRPDPAAECGPLNDSTTNNDVRKRAGARQPNDPEMVPESFPAALAEHLALVVGILREVAAAKNAAAVHRGAVARTLTARPLRPIVRAAHDFAAYFLAGKGANRPMRDVVAAYRNWLDREGDLQTYEPLPGAPANGRRPYAPGASDDVAARRQRRADALRRVTGVGAPEPTAEGVA